MMSTRHRILCGAVTLAVFCPAAAAVDFNAFKTDEETHKWLRKASATYAAMVKDVESRPNIRGFRFVTKKDIPGGIAVRVGRVMEIQLSVKLTGPRRISTLAFEMANSFRFPEHEAIDLAVDKGLIRTAEEFGLAHEIYEYEALRLHRKVLLEIASSHGPLPKDFYYLVTPPPRSAAHYRLPTLYQYLKTQKESGHTAHYYRHFRRRTAGNRPPGKAAQKTSSR